MATFIHLADERVAGRIRRGGIRATMFEGRRRDVTGLRRGIFCVPVVANFQTTFQWLRELKRRGHTRVCGIQFRIDDAELVFVGHYNQRPREMTAAQSVALFLRTEDPRGLQVVVPRTICAREITGVRAIPQVIGWRFYPAAKGRSPLWPANGSINASRLRRRIEQLNKSPWEV